MELNEMEKRMLFQVEGDYQYKVLNELHMAARYTKDPEQRKAAESLMAKLRVLTDDECMDIVWDIQKNYLLPYPPRTIGEKIAEARQRSGAEKLKGHDTRQRLRYGNGQLGDIEYTIHEKPVNAEKREYSPKRENPRQVNPGQAKPEQAEPGQENPTQLNTNPLRTKKSKTDISRTHQSIYPAEPEAAGRPDRMDRIELTDAYREIIKENIEFPDLNIHETIRL